MLRITVELLPAQGGPKQVKGIMEIANDGTGSHEVGHYIVKIFKTGTYRTVWKSGTVKNFPRSSKKLGVWDLLYRALKNVVGDRNRGS